MTHIGYALRVYPCFSGTFVVTEILAREAHGDDLRICVLRPTTDARSHPGIAQVHTQVSWIPRPVKASEFWAQLSDSLRHEDLRRRFAKPTPGIAGLPVDEVVQGISLAASVIDDGIDHLHTRFASLAGRMVWLASWLAGMPYAITTHAKGTYHKSMDCSWLRRTCDDADRVIAISHFNKRYPDEVPGGTGARISLQYNTLELERFPYRDPIQLSLSLRIATAGRLVLKKGFADLIDAAAALEVPAELDITGGDELHNEFAARIKRLDLDDHVRLVDPFTQNKVLELIRDSHVFTAPYIPADDGSINGPPTMVLGAMALGIPVAATSISSLPEVVRDSFIGILIGPGDVAVLIRSLAELAAGRVPMVILARNTRALIGERPNNCRQVVTLSMWGEGH